jgi:hypothetical protein
MSMQELGMETSRFFDAGNLRVYATPTLTRYGGLAELTAAGSKTPSESGGTKCNSMDNKLNTMCQ